MKTKVIAICLIVICLLSACGTNKADDASSKNSSGINPSTGEWVGTGGMYKLEASESPENTISAFVYGGELYYITFSLENGEEYSLQQDESHVLYTTSGNSIVDAAASQDGIWIVEDSTSSNNESGYLLKLISDDGDIINTLELYSETDSKITAILCTSDNLYLTSENKLMVLDLDGNITCTIDLSDSFSSVVLGNDNKVYIVEATDDGEEISEVDISSKGFSFLFSCSEGNIYNGNNDFLIILEANDGLYGIQQDGGTTPIVIWAECSISLDNLNAVIPLDDRFYCLLENGAYMLVPADISEMENQKKLVIASIGDSDSVKMSVSNFNSNSQDYYVEFVDYTNYGNLTEEEAIKKLNADIISGDCPDMICFSNLSPSAYITKGYLSDMLEYLEGDDEINIDDIVIANQLKLQDGIYYIDNTFYLETLVGLYSEFGDQYGWTLSKYLELESSRPANSETLYNTTKEQFVRQVSARYIRTAINWSSGTCNFDCDEYIQILEASNRIKESPEDENNLNTTYGPVRVAQGTLIAANSWINTVWKLAYEEGVAGCQLSYIGWPTVDGSSGSDIYLYEPVGIISQSSNGEACWEFIKFFLMDIDVSEDDGLPVYKPFLEKKVENAKTDKDLPIQITEENAEEFYSLLSSVENIAIYDEAVLEIIDEESSSLFNGDKTAKEVASIIQSRVSNYVSEQS